jgi:hypothetical protein
MLCSSLPQQHRVEYTTIADLYRQLKFDLLQEILSGLGMCKTRCLENSHHGSFFESSVIVMSTWRLLILP